MVITVLVIGCVVGWCFWLWLWFWLVIVVLVVLVLSRYGLVGHVREVQSSNL